MNNLLLVIAFTIFISGGMAMGYESNYPRTGVGEFEIKTLPAGKLLCAKTKGNYFENSNTLFMILFRYINAEKIPMTVPVEADINPGEMRFHINKELSDKEFSNSGLVTVALRPARLVAALGVSGSYSNNNFLEAKTKLEQWLAKQPGYVADGPAYMSYWNSPMVPFFFKKAEVLIPVKKVEGIAMKASLSTEEAAVIIRKGTEPPFTGKYCEEFRHGLYLCRQCGYPLYRSDDKFKTDCGWPGFDDELPGAIKRIPDRDGNRIEIVCAQCDGHLGHVFKGESLTPKDTRHCVNSISMQFEPSGSGKYDRGFFAGGCFWGVEYFMKQIPGVAMVTSGYMGGDTPYPSYEEVCSGKTGHAEVVEVIFDTSKASYETISKTFLEIHDPTQLNRQGPDIGNQYRSVIFYLNDRQKQIVESLLARLRANGVAAVTVVEPATHFWSAENQHQNYYGRKNSIPYCHALVKRFKD